ncbi:NAD(P)H-hydrate dehydratase [Aerococcaceae bacterium 50-4]
MAFSKVDLNLAVAKDLVPVRDSSAYKNNFGHVFIIAGNASMGGAGQMAGMAAVYSGAGLTSIATDQVNLPAIHTVLPEAMVVDWTNAATIDTMIEKADVVLIGPGFGRDNTSLWRQIKDALAKANKALKVTLDADGLNLLADDLNGDPIKSIKALLSPEDQHTIILTPHIGEWRRLTNGKIPADDYVSVQEWVNHEGVILVLKGAPTEIYFPNDQAIWRNTGGNPGMAIGGMGDTLAGMIAGLSGQISKTHDAVKLAVFLHSYIADQLYETQYVVLPSQLSAEIPKVMKSLSEKK